MLFLIYSRSKKIVNVYENGFARKYYVILLTVLKGSIVLWSS